MRVGPLKRLAQVWYRQKQMGGDQTKSIFWKSMDKSGWSRIVCFNEISDLAIVMRAQRTKLQAVTDYLETPFI